MKYRFISDHRETFKIGRMCKLLNISRSEYYGWQKRPESRRSLENRALEGKILVFHKANHGKAPHAFIGTLSTPAPGAVKTALPGSCEKPAFDPIPKESSWTGAANMLQSIVRAFSKNETSFAA